MDQHPQIGGGDASRLASTPMPTARQVLVGAMPSAAVLVIASPPLLWWLLDTPTGEVRTRWWPVLLGSLVALCLVIGRLGQARRPRLPQVPSRRIRSALVSSSRTGSVPSDPEVRTAAGVTACLRLEAAVAGVATAAAALGTALLLSERPWTSFAVVTGVLAAVHVLRARHSPRYLTALHSGERTG